MLFWLAALLVLGLLSSDLRRGAEGWSAYRQDMEERGAARRQLALEQVHPALDPHAERVPLPPELDRLLNPKQRAAVQETLLRLGDDTAKARDFLNWVTMTAVEARHYRDEASARLARPADRLRLIIGVEVAAAGVLFVLLLWATWVWFAGRARPLPPPSTG